jgi:ubiquinone biosynthesis protein
MRVRVIRRQLTAEDSRQSDRTPTPLMPDQASAPVVIQPIPRLAYFRGLHIIFIFGRLFARLAVLKMTRRYEQEAFAINVRRVFQNLGGLWIKVGQLMSLRSDALPEAVCAELARLQSRAEGFDPQVSVARIVSELGRPVENVFSRFDEMPFAAASLAQGHFAILRDTDAPVVVKVQRPDVAEGFRRDLHFIRSVVGFLKFFNIASWLNFDDMMWELREIMREEIDYRYESSNLVRLRKNLKAHDIITPKPHLNYCTPGVMVMEFMSGVPMADFIALQRSDPQRARSWLNENDIAEEVVAQKLISSLLRQVFEDNLFHGDLHPGNIMLFRNNGVAFIDFGTAGTLEPEFLEIYSIAISSIVRRRYRRASDYILALCRFAPSSDLGRVRDEMVRAFRSWEMRSNLHNATYFERSLSAANDEINKILTENRIQPSWALLKLARTLGTLDATIAALVPQRDIRGFYIEYFRQRQRREWTPAAAARRSMKGLAEASQIVQEAKVVLLPFIRNQTLGVRGTLDKFSSAASVALIYLRLGVLGAVVSLAFYLFSSGVGIEEHAMPQGVLGVLSGRPWYHWVFISLVLVVLARLLQKMARILRSG